MGCVTVTTAEELKKAIKEKQDKIIVSEKLARKVKKAEKIKKLSPTVLGMIGALGAAAVAGVAAAPATGGGSALFFAAAAAPVSAASGLSIPVLILISGVGLTLISILFDEYTHMEIGGGKIIFERKHKDKKADMP